MPQDGYYLTQEDVEALRDLLEQSGKTVHSLTVRGRPRTDLNDQEVTPQTYVVLTPVGGIPALTEGPDAGTALGTGDIPGAADCKIYRLLTVSGTLQLEPTAFTRKVYNLGTTAIAGTNWALVTRDGFGAWYATGVTTATGGGTGTSGIEIKENVGTADFTPTTVLIVNQTDGFQIVQTAGSTVRLDFLAASTTQKGAVTTGAQTIKGPKTFTAAVNAIPAQFVFIDLGATTYTVSVATGTGGIFTVVTISGVVTFETTAVIGNVTIGGTSYATHGLSAQDLTGTGADEIIIDLCPGGSCVVFTKYHFGNPTRPDLKIHDGTSYVAGLTSVVGPLTFTSGLCTTASWPAGVSGTFGG